MTSDDLILTKLYRPQPRASLVPRPRLIERLNEGLRGKMTLLSAPPGFGKTTLLSDWASQARRQVAWLTLDERDNDPARFLTYLIAALRSLDEDVGQFAQGMLQARGQPDHEAILTSLINDLVETPAGAGRPQLLILDDYQLITARAVHEAVSFLVDYLPPRMHLIIASRTDPELSLGRLRVSGRLMEVRAADLRFTEAEIAVFFRESMGLALSAGDLASLSTRTEGWAAGLQVAALSMRGRADVSSFITTFSGSNRYILEYLVEEVLERQPEHIQRFLLHTAVLERLSGPLCDAVLGVEGQAGPGPEDQGTGSQVVLAELEASNLFITPLDDERRYYRYHPLFAEFLRSHLQATQPALIPLLHKRAARWLERHGRPDEAVGHALAAGEEREAARLVESAAKQMVRQGEWRTLQGWLEALPEEQVRDRPRLALAQAWAHLFSSPPDETEAWLLAAERRLPPAEETSMGEQQLMALRGEIGAIRATMASAAGDTQRTIELGRQALAQLPEDDRFLRTAIILAMGYAYRYSGDLAAAQAHFEQVIALGRESGNRYQELDGLCNLANQQLYQGRRRAAAQTAEQALQITEAIRGNPPSIAAEVYLINGVLLYEKNELEAAGDFMERSLALSELAGLSELIYAAHFWLSLVDLAEGREEEATRHMDEAERVVKRLDNRRATRHVAAGRVRLLLALGDLAPLGRWAAEIEAAGSDRSPDLAPVREFEELTLVQLYLATERSGDALTLLARLRAAAETAGRAEHVYRIMALQALGLAAQGDTPAALSVLAQLLPTTAVEKYVRLYLDLGRPMAVLLRQAAAAGIEPAEANRLLEAFAPGDGDETNGAAHTPISLTRREKEVLALIAAGQSNRQIADELVISLGTVKRHISNIYGKLGARRRTQAVAIAKEMGLLGDSRFKI